MVSAQVLLSREKAPQAKPILMLLLSVLALCESAQGIALEYSPNETLYSRDAAER